MIKFSKNNSKLKKDRILSFGLPSIITCPKADKCKSICYAMQGCYTFKVVKQARLNNYIESQKDTFVNEANIYFAKSKYHYVRVHDSGDFYSQIYLDKWFTIAKSNPTKIFYAYTKSLHLDFTNKPLNFIIIQSLGGQLDSQIDYNNPVARIFESQKDLLEADYIDCTTSDLIAISGIIKIGLVYHGTKNLTIQL
jgi:hypothetical protein